MAARTGVGDCDARELAEGSRLRKIWDGAAGEESLCFSRDTRLMGPRELEGGMPFDHLAAAVGIAHGCYLMLREHSSLQMI